MQIGWATKDSTFLNHVNDLFSNFRIFLIIYTIVENSILASIIKCNNFYYFYTRIHNIIFDFLILGGIWYRR